MIEYQVSLKVNKPAADVFKFVCHDYFVNHPKWDSRVVNLKVDTEGPVKVGTKGHETRKEAGRSNTFAFEVTDYKPGSMMAFKASGGPVKITSVYGVSSLGAKESELNVKVNMKMGGPMMLMEPFMRGGVKKEFDKITAEIKRMVEEQK